MRCHERAQCSIKDGIRDCYCEKGFDGDGLNCRPGRYIWQENGIAWLLQSQEFGLDRCNSLKIECLLQELRVLFGMCGFSTGVLDWLLLAGFGECGTLGDPHYITFDRVRYEFQGDCEYTLVRDCPASADLPSFHVKAKNRKIAPQALVSVTARVTLDLEGTQYSFLPGGEVRIDGVTATLPVRRPDGVSISRRGAWMVSVRFYR